MVAGSIQPAKYTSKNLTGNVLSNDRDPWSIISYNLPCNGVFYFKFFDDCFSWEAQVKSSSTKNLMGIKK